VAALGAVSTSFALVQKMKVDVGYLRYVLGGVIADENQKLLLKLEELIMSNLTPVLQSIQSKVAELKRSVDTLNANATERSITIDQLTAENTQLKNDAAATAQKIADLQAAATAAQQNATDPADVQLAADILAMIG
jgi:peptidoglycan hydrolase CwlO-like protein